jgi:hypothetical protein
VRETTVKLSHRRDERETRRKMRARNDCLPLATRKRERESTDGRGRREREAAGERRPLGVRERERQEARP